jgi:hypothetical protein
MPSGLVRAVAVILSIAIVRSQQPPALSPHTYTPPTLLLRSLPSAARAIVWWLCCAKAPR